MFLYFKKIYYIFLQDIVQCYRLLDKQLRLAILLLAFLMLAQAVMELVTINGIRQLGLVTSNPDGLAQEQPWLLLFAISPEFAAWAAASAEHYLFLAACFVVLLIALKNIITWWTMWKTGQVSEAISLNVAEEIMRRYLYGEYRWHLSREASTALQILLWRSNLAALLVQQLTALTGFLACAILFLGLITQEPVISLVTIGIIGSSAILLYGGLRKKIDRSAAAAAASNKEENATFIAATRGVRDVIIYGQQGAFLKKMQDILRLAVRPKIFLSVANSIPSTVLEVLGFVMIPLTILLMSRWGAGMEAILSAVMLLVLTAWRVLPYLNRGVGQMMAIRALRPMALPVLEFLHKLRSQPEGVAVAPEAGGGFTKSIELVQASFTYPGAARPSLYGVSMVIPKGSFVGIVGPSGAGKSTLCYLLSGLCRPDSGRFLVDGRELDAVQLAAFRRRISFVPQAPFLMADSLAANVAFSQWGKAWDEAGVIEACRKASIDFTPLDGNGILYTIGENGAGLSGGQAQRVAIARALYARPEILIFDEATSALDTGNENYIISSVEKLRGNMTCIIIAHRLTTVENCDMLYWIDGGRVVEYGEPAKVLPRYREHFSTHDLLNNKE
ncbi:MAG: ABC transporter ATP-binding protein [Lachnospiraceae bacterium]|nr:ABC transporter ATP-binding protein [Lachnospiraceae bacterium]